MTSKRILAISLVGVAASGALAAAANATDAGTTADITLLVHHGSETSVDLGKHGFSAGDPSYFTGAVTQDGAPAGHLVGTCTPARVSRTSADMLCEYVLTLSGGQITALGSLTSGPKGPGTVALPIVGGTGTYAKAAGEISVTATSGKTFPIVLSVR